MVRSAFVAIAAILPLFGAGDRPRLRPVPPTDQNMRTGPAAGEHIPEFEAIDQDGRRQTFESLRGPHGLALFFVRSADW